MAFTIAPFNNLDIPNGETVAFGDKFALRSIPEWFPGSEMLTRLSYVDQQHASSATCALISDYDAKSIGEPDASAPPDQPRSIQKRKFDSILLGNFALWLAQPSRACFSIICHGLHWDIPGEQTKQPLVQQVERQTAMHCHPDDENKRMAFDQVKDAGILHGALVDVPRKNPVWQAMRMFWAALSSYAPDIRYSLYWVGMEALFGPDGNTGEITYKLAQRAAFFVGTTPDEARDIFAKMKKCYATRSRITHGRWEYDPSIDTAMVDTEMIVRSTAVRLLRDQRLRDVFISKKRDQFLEDWVFSRSTDPPPFPEWV